MKTNPNPTRAACSELSALFGSITSENQFSPPDGMIRDFLDVRLSDRTPMQRVHCLYRLHHGLTLLYPGRNFDFLLHRIRAERQVLPRAGRRPTAPRPDAISLHFSLWPKDVRERWLGLENVVGRRARRKSIYLNWKETTRNDYKAAYGVWLAYVRRKRLNDPIPREGPFLDMIEAWESGVGTKRGPLSSMTIKIRLNAICRVARALYPEEDFEWLLDEVADAQALATPKRHKADRLAHSSELAVLGLFLMHLARTRTRDTAAARLHRDGLFIYMLAYRPARVGNMVETTISRNLRIEAKAGEIYWPDSKGGRPIAYELSEDIVLFLREHLDHFRPLLLPTSEQIDRLWLSDRGAPITCDGMRARIGRHCQKYLKKNLSPHLFRDSAATTMIEETPEAVELIGFLLTHSNERVKETYRQHARMIGAQRKAAPIIDRYSATNAPVWLRREMERIGRGG